MDGLPIDINIPESELVRMEEVIRGRGRFARRNSIDRVGAIKSKNSNRESIMGREDLGAIENLAMLFQDVEKYGEHIDEFYQKRRMHFLKEMKAKMLEEDYHGFLASLELFRVPEGGRIIDEGKYHNFHYILIEGEVAAYRQKKQKDEEREEIEMFSYQPGEVLISNQLQTHKANPYTVRAKKVSMLLRFKDETFNRYLKKIWMREIDELAALLGHTLVFKAIPLVQIKKYLPYCSVRRYRYNELVYGEGDLIKQLFLILDGEAEISYDREDANRNKHSKTMLAPLASPNFHRMNHQPTDKKELKIVRVGRNELFGLQAYDLFAQNYYKHNVRVMSTTFKTFVIGLNVILDMETENPILEENLDVYLKKINHIHGRLLHKSQQITFNLPQKKKKKKKKMRRRTQNSLEWWGLAAKIEDSKKYRLPTPPPKHSSAGYITKKAPLKIENRVNKLDNFKRRLFEDEIEAIEAMERKENFQPKHTGGLMPRLNKLKIRMINLHPKVVNNAEQVKRKLLEYAKNEEVFCDRLQLQ